MVKGTDCLSRGIMFDSQDPHGGSQPSLAAVPESSGILFWLPWVQTHGMHRHTCRQNI